MALTSQQWRNFKADLRVMRRRIRRVAEDSGRPDEIVDIAKQEMFGDVNGKPIPTGEIEQVA